MKHIGNLDVTGDFKVRGVFNDKLKTEGGFYSKQFGELAYKTDTVGLGGDSQYFYGLVVKTDNNLQKFRDINTVSFNADDFYLSTPTGGSANGVVVHLRRAVAGTRSGPHNVTYKRCTLSTEVEMFSHVIPANTLTTGKVIKITMFGTARFNGGAGVTVSVVPRFKLNGTTVAADASANFTNSANYRSWRFEIYLVQQNFHQLQFIPQQLMVSAGLAGTAQYGDFTLDCTPYGMVWPGGEVTSQPTSDRTISITVEVTPSGPVTAEVFWDFYFSKVEFIN